MAKAPKKLKSKVVDVQEDGTEVFGFDPAPAEERAVRKLQANDDIKQHPKFHKFIKGNE